MTFQNYLVKDGQAVPENPEPGYEWWDSHYDKIEWEKFETWKQSHTYATDAKDGCWPVELFEIVWQISYNGGAWHNVKKSTYEKFKNYDDFNADFNKNGIGTRQFAKFKEDPKKSIAEMLGRNDDMPDLANHLYCKTPDESDIKWAKDKIKEVEKPKESEIKNDMNTETTQLFDRFDENSRLMVEDTYDLEQEYSYVAGKNIMFENDFKEAAIQLAKEYGYWLNNNWFIPTTDGNWKQDIHNPEYQLSIAGLRKESFWNDDELFEMFNNKKGDF